MESNVGNLTEKFIEMGRETAHFIYENYGDIGTIIMESDDLHQSVVIGHGSDVNKPSSLYPYAIDGFNLNIWPKYPYFKNITIKYFYHMSCMNVIVAFNTQVTSELKIVAKELCKETEKELEKLKYKGSAYEIYQLSMDFRFKLASELRKLILKYIKNYDSSISDIDSFIEKYQESYDFLFDKVLDKVIETL